MLSRIDEKKGLIYQGQNAEKGKKSQRILNDQAILTQVYSTLKVKEVETILNGLFN